MSRNKRFLLINSVLGFGSTGKIVLDIAKEYEQKGYEVKVAYGRIVNNSEAGKKYGIRIGNKIDVYSHVLITRLFDKHGLASKKATKKFLKWADDYNPDELWLHNIHGYYINYELLFEWIKKRPQMKIKWTLHDCWPFTGHCSHFSYVKCDKWKTGCNHCPQLNQYPRSIIDKSKSNFHIKKKAFTDVKNMTLVTPSKWLKDLVKESFLSEYLVEVVHNKIDTNIFKPTNNSFKANHGIEGKKMILGVANIWNDRKGLNDFIELSKILDNQYKIVLVGLNTKQIEILKSAAPNIMALPRTTTASELVELYSAADIYVNSSYEETFGLTTVEAISCGTKAIVYAGTAAEEIAKEYGGVVIESGAKKVLEFLQQN